jgi:hypothetical protein
MPAKFTQDIKRKDLSLIVQFFVWVFSVAGKTDNRTIHLRHEDPMIRIILIFKALPPTFGTLLNR